MDKFGKILIAVVCVIAILFIVIGSIHFVTGGGDSETLVFREVNPEHFKSVEIIHITDEDYAAFSILKEIPKEFDIDKSVFAPILKNFGYLDKETAYAIADTYSSFGYPERLIEHEGVIYKVEIRVA